jgi:hypothetical protein
MNVILTHDLMQYLAAVEMEIQFRGNPDSIATTDRCPECGERVDDIDTEHVVLELSSDVYAVIVGCEGYWVINPALVGLTVPSWQPVEGLNDQVTGVHSYGCNGKHMDGECNNIEVRTTPTADQLQVMRPRFIDPNPNQGWSDV